MGININFDLFQEFYQLIQDKDYKIIGVCYKKVNKF
jgi:hypothetical protein